MAHPPFFRFSLSEDSSWTLPLRVAGHWGLRVASVSRLSLALASSVLFLYFPSADTTSAARNHEPAVLEKKIGE